MNPEQELGRMLRERNKTIAVAESMTGGLVGDIITNVPGSSKYFEGGIVAYSDQSKQELLGVRPETLRIQGAVSEQCAREMAAGVREKFHTHIGLSVTGIAGPTGATFGKPVGLVIFAYDDGKVRMTDHKTFAGEREEIKRAAAEHLVTMTLELLHEE
jgi:PncC family amidohydrolase